MWLFESGFERSWQQFAMLMLKSCLVLTSAEVYEHWSAHGRLVQTRTSVALVADGLAEVSERSPAEFRLSTTKVANAFPHARLASH